MSIVFENRTDKEIEFIPNKTYNTENKVSESENIVKDKMPSEEPDFIHTQADKPLYKENPNEIMPQADWKTCTVILIIGYIILKSTGTLINFSEWSSTDLLIILMVIGLTGFGLYKLLNEGV
ncbi:hypothetical protein AN639_01155 [Candidatus Epulonipiscium fishelsonii]|uniref:Uncharacterized protein n=1 Tax=Candidatus Epulonipiscium fishelsonii TaxID=77094 RepID=A0ACC8X7W7_9FIRM|nr:hypothetical protein AN396_12090 [Epulopiscium sp. SCG-B11WGA-EpuloA1]ONI40716.1 hypothetical protein AN639_01155 [Epulopiscium sp. SCG-B05WGA-EpuloA1]